MKNTIYIYVYVSINFGSIIKIVLHAFNKNSILQNTISSLNKKISLYLIITQIQ